MFTLAQLQIIAYVCIAVQIISAFALLAAALCFLRAVRFQKQYMFMIQLLFLIILITLSSIALMGVNTWRIEYETLDTIPVEISLCVINFFFWMPTYLTVWLIAFKYHEQSR
jgi:hypothetical protein